MKQRSARPVVAALAIGAVMAFAPLASFAAGNHNDQGNDDQSRIQDNYRDNYNRLVEVKRAYDPDNLFHHNQNIKP